MCVLAGQSAYDEPHPVSILFFYVRRAILFRCFYIQKTDDEIAKHHTEKRTNQTMEPLLPLYLTACGTNG
jgi:hypothetical protein